MIAWIDVETTGTDYENDHLLEIGLIITNDRGEHPVEYTDASLVEYSDKRINAMRSNASRRVDTMHTASGLWDELKASSLEGGTSVSTDTLDMLIVDFFVETKNSPEFYGEDKTLYLGGTSTLLDRIFVNKFLPMTASFLSYHSIDTAVLHTMASVGDGVEPYGRKDRFSRPHRALEDVKEAIEAYRYYLTRFGVMSSI